jgi:hypothetical protein
VTVQHLGSWLALGGLRELGFYEVADQHRGEAVEMPSLRPAIDAAAIALALGEVCVEGVRRLATPSVETLRPSARCSGSGGGRGRALRG